MNNNSNDTSKLKHKKSYNYNYNNGRNIIRKSIRTKIFWLACICSIGLAYWIYLTFSWVYTFKHAIPAEINIYTHTHMHLHSLIYDSADAQNGHKKKVRLNPFYHSLINRYVCI